MNIGDASKSSGVSATMIRYYESIGLIEAANRTESGYRSFTENNIHTLRFIRNARDLGFKVKAIAHLLGLWQDRTRQSVDVKEIALEHICALEVRISELQSMVSALQSLADNCNGDSRPDCPILIDLQAKEV